MNSLLEKKILQFCLRKANYCCSHVDADGKRHMEENTGKKRRGQTAKMRREKQTSGITQPGAKQQKTVQRVSRRDGCPWPNKASVVWEPLRVTELAPCWGLLSLAHGLLPTQRLLLTEWLFIQFFCTSITRQVLIYCDCFVICFADSVAFGKCAVNSLLKILWSSKENFATW